MNNFNDQYPTWVPIGDERIEELRRLYKEAYGDELTREEAREMGSRLVAFYRLLLQKLPNEHNSMPLEV